MTRKEIQSAHIKAGVTRVYYAERDEELFEEYGKWCYLFRVLGAILDEKIDQLPTAA